MSPSKERSPPSLARRKKQSGSKGVDQGLRSPLFDERDSIGVMDPWPTGSEWAQSITHRPFCPVVMVAEEYQVLETVVRTVLSTQFWHCLTPSAERHT